MTEKKDPPVQIVKKKGGHGGHHGGAWKVAYADFVTAMMALFIVLWIVGQSKPVKDAIATYFKDPAAFSKSSGSDGILPGASVARATPEVGPRRPPRDRNEEIARLKAEGERIVGMIHSVSMFEKFRDRVQIQTTGDGLRIELIENASGLFFDVGSNSLKAETVELLKLVGKEVGKLDNPVVIEGYTDARPFASKGYSNWELSTERANAARKILEESGLRKDQVIEVRGFADRKLRNPDDPLDFSNRRVSIYVSPLLKEEPARSASRSPGLPATIKPSDISKGL